MKSVSSIAPAVVAELLRRQPSSPHKIHFAWRVAVGPALARATEVSLGADGLLDVRAPSEHWRREVHRSRDVIVKRLSELLGPGAVKGIRVET